MGTRRSKFVRPARSFLHLARLEDRTTPTTFYVDPAFIGSPDGATVTFNNGYPGQQGGLTYSSSLANWQANPTRTAFSDLLTAIEASEDPVRSPGADTIMIAHSANPIPVDNGSVATTATTGNWIAITQPLSLIGSGVGATVLAPTANTQFGLPATPDDLTPVFRAAGPGVNPLTVSNLTFDGAGKQIGIAFTVRDGATATFDNVDVRNITPPPPPPGFTPNGNAIEADNAFLTVQNSRISNYTRDGIFYSSSAGAVSNVTLAGPNGTTNFTNGVEVIGNSNVTITGSTITGNTGQVAPTRGSGVAVGADSGVSPTVSLIGNLITGNAVGLNVGTGAADTSAVTAQFNNIVGNDTGVDATGLTAGAVQAPNNWWGAASGPLAPSSPGGQGNPVTVNVAFTPFLTSPTPVQSAATPAAYLSDITVVGTSVSPLAGQPNPVTSGPVQFTVTFARPVSGFDASDVTLVSSPGGSPSVSVSPTGATNVASYTVTVSGVSGVGPVSVQVKPQAAQTADGFLTAQSGVATVDFGVVPPPPPPANTPPTISDIPDQTVQSGGTLSNLPFAIGDAQTPASALTVTATSSSPALTPTVTLSGSGAQRFVTVATAAGTSGIATVTVTVTDAQGAAATDSFNVNITAAPPANTPPTISAIPNQTVQSGGTISSVPFTVGDAETPAASLNVSATSSNPALTPTVALSGSGAQRAITVGTAAGSSGTATVTVTVTDAQGATATDTFDVTVLAPPPPGRVHLTAVGADAGGGPVVQVYNADGSPRFVLLAYSVEFTGGVRVATGDIDGDGTDDIIVGAGVGGGPDVRVFDGKDGSLLYNFMAFDPALRGGTNVGAGDVDGDGREEIIVGAGLGGGPEVEVYNAGALVPRFQFFAFEPALRTGVSVAAGDLNGDGKAEILAGAGFGGAPVVAVFNGTNGADLGRFFAYDSSFRNGVFVAAGDLDGDGKAEIVTGPGIGGGPDVRVYDGTTRLVRTSFFADDVTVRSGIRVAVDDVNADGKPDVITGGGPGVGPHVRGLDVFTGGAPTEVFSAVPFPPSFRGGVYVG